MNKVLKGLLIVFVGVVLISLIGRNCLILGTFLIITRWFILLAFMFFIYFSNKGNNYKLKKMLVFLFSIFLLETIYVQTRTSNFSIVNKGNEKLKILSYNVYFKNQDKNASLNLIKNKDADLVLLQEITPSWNSKLNANLKHYHKITKALKGTHGISVYSKHPLKLIKYFNNKGGLPFAQIVELKMHAKKILVCHVHFASPAKAVENPDKFFPYYLENYELRKKQYKTLDNFVISIENKYDEILFVGDLNTTEYEPLFRDIRYEWNNASNNYFKKSFPNSYKMPALVNLDYIFFRKNAKKILSEVLKGGSSDHAAIYSEIEF
jgi:endonuclease/exonuclease/phosphatase (EEP) superfamily protein YafD